MTKERLEEIRQYSAWLKANEPGGVQPFIEELIAEVERLQNVEMAMNEMAESDMEIMKGLSQMIPPSYNLDRRLQSLRGE